MKVLENCTRIHLPRRTYTLMRFDGKAFHSFTRKCQRPFDESLRRCMDAAALAVCKEAAGCRIGYVQSDEITIVMTDFETFTTEAYFDGNIQKLCSILATTVANAFNEQWQLEILRAIEVAYTQNVGLPFGALSKASVEDIIKCPKAKFDARTWTISDPWEVFNTFKWRQDDATRNAIQMVAQSMYSHKELHGKNQSAMQEMIFQRGDNFNNYPTKFKRGSFLYKNDNHWVVDTEAPIINQEREYFFSKLPLLDRPPVPTTEA
jgi:tRNA(His) 5'-end guanylyltransferase